MKTMKREEGWNDWHQIPKPDWDFWQAIPEPALIECVLLSLNAEPREYEPWWLRIKKMLESIEIAKNNVYARKLKIPGGAFGLLKFTREVSYNSECCMTDPQLSTPVNLVEFSRLVVSFGWEIPKKMKAMTKPPKVKATPGPTLQPAPSVSTDPPIKPEPTAPPTETPDKRRKRLLEWAKEEVLSEGKRGVLQRVAVREGMLKQKSLTDQAIRNVLNANSFPEGKAFLQTLSDP